MAVPNRPAAGAVVESAWGAIAHDTAVALDYQSGHFTTNHAAANVSPTVSVVFPRPFAGPPVVVLSSDNFNYGIGLNGAAPTATGFIAATKRIDGSAPTAAIPCEWFAVGPRA